MSQDNFSWLDHIVLACPDLQEGMDYVLENTDCDPSYGGKHQQFGTHNALLKIGNLTYLEILAPDPDNPKNDLRWMGVDLVKEPTITRLAIKSTEISTHARSLANFSPNHGHVQEGRRQKKSGELLTWELTMPPATPVATCVPFLIDWQDSIHPTIGLNDQCTIEDLQLFSPDPNFPDLLKNLKLPLTVNHGEERITLSLNTPKGLVKF